MGHHVRFFTISVFVAGNSILLNCASRFSLAEIREMGKLPMYSGGFDPVHEGHYACIAEASEKYGPTVIIANSDAFLRRKRANMPMLVSPLLPLKTRMTTLARDAGVAIVIESIDHDQTVCETIKAISSIPQITCGYFVNGGDRSPGTVPEDVVCDRFGIEMVWSCGGDMKLRQSSVICMNAAALSALNATEHHTTRWGSFCTVRKESGLKEKILQFNPEGGVSLQTHKHRHETWKCLSGSGYLYLGKLDGQGRQIFTEAGEPVFGKCVLLQEGDTEAIALGQAHMSRNVSCTEEWLVYEFQNGSKTIEDDIFRFGDPFNKLSDRGRCASWLKTDVPEMVYAAE